MLAAKVVNDYPHLIKNTGTKASFIFWNWVALIIFICSIYFSFTSNWWYFIPGFILMTWIYSANKRGNATNFLDCALQDEKLYTVISDVNGWQFQIQKDRLNELENYIIKK